jgi:hypothetical protein
MGLNAQTVWNVATPGSLATVAGDALLTTANVKITGNLNGADLYTIRKMCGVFKDKVALTDLDLSDANIVESSEAWGKYGTNDPVTSSVASARGFDVKGTDANVLPAGLFFGSYIGVKSVKLPNSVKTIGDFAMHSVQKATEITLPSKVETIGKYAFRNCRAITSITIPKTCSNIGEGAFTSCYSVKKIVIGDDGAYCYCGWYAFSLDYADAQRASLTTIILGKNTKSFGACPFQWQEAMVENVYIYNEEGIITIEQNKGLFERYGNTGSIVNADASVLNLITVHVPSTLVDAYKADANWSSMNIVALTSTDPTPTTTAVKSIYDNTDEAKVLKRYSVNGTELSAPSKGINILRMSDGSVKKVIVR